MSVRILIGDVREQLATLPDESVHCVVTSPPYWGLRDYGIAGQLGLEPTLGEHLEAMVAVFRAVRRVSQDVANQVGSARAHAGGKTNGNMKAVIRSPKVGGGGARSRNNQSFVDATCLPVMERNLRNVWTIPTAAFSEAHFATFPPALVEPCIKAGCPVGGTVLDPFGGAGTTGLVADRLGRDAILIELNPEYAALAERRIRGDAPMFVDVKAGAAA